MAKDGDYDYIDADPAADGHRVVTSPESGGLYDILPRPTAALLPPKKLTPSAKTGATDAKKRDSFVRPARIYDVLPRQAPRSVAVSHNQLKMTSTDAAVPVATLPVATTAAGPQSTIMVSLDDEDFTAHRRLPLYEPLHITKQAAVTRISIMQSQLQTELSRLFSFVSHETWRETSNLVVCLGQVKLCCENLVRHLTALVRFLLRAALAPTTAIEGQAGMEQRLRALVDAVFAGCRRIRERLAALNRTAWSPSPATIASVEAIVATGQTLTEDVRRMTAFVLGNAQLIFSDEEEARLQLRPLPVRPHVIFAATEAVAVADDAESDHEYEDVDYGHVSGPVQPRSPKIERRILSSYIQEVTEEVSALKPAIAAYVRQMFAESTVTSPATMEKEKVILQRASKLARLTESLATNLTLQETLELRTRLRKIGGYITTACKTFGLAIRAATKTADEEKLRSVKASLDYLGELCQFLRNSTETEV